MASTPEQRDAFVEQCRRAESIAYLDGTRDTYHTVIVATLSSNAAEDIQEAAQDAGYHLATTWTTMLFRIYVFSTTPTDLPTVLSTATPPTYLVSDAIEYFSDVSHAR